jgi:hypothetical protein
LGTKVKKLSTLNIAKLALCFPLAVVLVAAIVFAAAYVVANQRLRAQKASLMDGLGIGESDLVTLHIAERPLRLQVAALSSIDRMLQAQDCGPQVDAIVEGPEPESPRSIVVAVEGASVKRRAIVHLIGDPSKTLGQRAQASFACAGEFADSQGVTNYYGCYLGTPMARFLSLDERERSRTCQSYEDYAYQAVTTDCAALDGLSDPCRPKDRDLWTLDRAEDTAGDNPALAKRLARVREARHR